MGQVRPIVLHLGDFGVWIVRIVRLVVAHPLTLACLIELAKIFVGGIFDSFFSRRLPDVFLQSSPLSRGTMLFIAASASNNVESTAIALPFKNFFVWAISRAIADQAGSRTATCNGDRWTKLTVWLTQKLTESGYIKSAAR